jgi:ribulose 1,5-bisphosphate carboxylase large subunit-like protein
MENVELTIAAEDADEKALHKFVDDLQRLTDLPTTKIDVARRSPTSLELKIRYPLNIFDHSVSQFLAVLFGEIPFMRAFGRARFEDLTLPAEVYEWFGGPAFGADAVLERFGAARPPLLIAILKPSLDPNATLPQLEERIAGPLQGGFHAAKDDEMQGDFASLSLNARIALARRNPRYIPSVNLDDVSAFREVLAHSEIGMVITNPTILGFPGLHQLRKTTQVPILAHLSMQGVYATCFSHRLFALLHRLFGSDAFISPIGETHYYRASKADESEMVYAFTSDLPMPKTLPLLTGGGSMNNLEGLMTPYEQAKVPYGIVLGGLIFNSDRPPAQMAGSVVRKVADVHRAIAGTRAQNVALGGKSIDR